MYIFARLDKITSPAPIFALLAKYIFDKKTGNLIFDEIYLAAREVSHHTFLLPDSPRIV